MLQKYITNNTYKILFLGAVYYFFTILITRPALIYIGDLAVYIEISQNLFSGGVLYQTAIDIKNMGFFFFFYYILYMPYALLFTTMEYFFVWQAIFLTFWYFGTAVLIYQILLHIYDKYLSTLSAFIYFIFISSAGHTFFINQPQIALVIYLLLILYILKTFKEDLYRHYFGYGVLLGLSFSTSSPYAFLVFIVPALAFIQYSKDKLFLKVVYRGCSAFAGFLLALLPFFIYFYNHNAISDWWYWNFTFATGTYATDEGKYNLGIFSRLGSAIHSMLGSNMVINIRLMDTVFTHVYIYFNILTWVLFLKSSKKTSFSIDEKLLFISSSFCILSRLCMTRGSLSYNTYIVPYVILQIPFVYSFLKSTKLHKSYLRFIIVSIAFSTIYLPMRASNSGIENKLPDPIKQLSILNPDKTPTVILGHSSGFTYSTRWKHLYYNVYQQYDNSFQENVYLYNPEVLIIRQFTLDNQLNADSKFTEYLTANYHPISKDYTITANSGVGILYIRKDTLHTWTPL